LNSRRLIIFENLFAIDDDRHNVAPNNNLLSPSFVILRRGLSDVNNVIEAGGFFPITMRVIDLAFEASAWPVSSLIFGMEVDAAVGMRPSHDIDSEMKILERLFIPDVVKVAAVSVGYQSAVFDLPRVRMFLGLFPTIECFAIEELDEPFFSIGSKKRLG
jgi:hypothetical protein